MKYINANRANNKKLKTNDIKFRKRPNPFSELKQTITIVTTQTTHIIKLNVNSKISPILLDLFDVFFIIICPFFVIVILRVFYAQFVKSMNP
jgi:hypothetical protein